MSTALLALALLIGVGIIAFLISLGLTGLGVLLSWIFPLTPFQGTLVHLVIFSLALAFMGVTLLFERVKDTLWSTPDKEDDLNEEIDFRLHEGSGSTIQRPLPPRSEPAKIGRNDPCPCGSGKKYKFCCLMKRERGQS
jgi:SEC-C motif-containing protein